MEQEFWQARWRENRIGFHEAAPNSLLTRHFPRLGLRSGQSVFVPLCGKALDLDWLLSQGLRVAGVEFNQGAVEEVFARLRLDPEVTRQGGLTRYRDGELTLYSGDFFALTPAELGPVDAIYDRAALVAVKPEDRAAYAAHLNRITGTARQFLIGFDYDQSLMQGPPFSVPGAMVQELYGGSFSLDLLESGPADGPMAQRVNAQEEIWSSVKDEVEQVTAHAPAIGRWLLPPCGLRHRAGVSPKCPEGERYCGVRVWTQGLDEYARKL